MNHFLSVATLLVALAYSALAAPSKNVKPIGAKCPQCKMTLAAKADKAHPVAVKVNGKTLYCCAACGRHKDVKPKTTSASKSTLKPTTTKKTNDAPDCPKCGMKMALAKSPLKATAMKVNGATYYCCTICPSH